MNVTKLKFEVNSCQTSNDFRRTEIHEFFVDCSLVA